MNWRSIVVGIILGLFFESVLNNFFTGFYFIPVIFVAVIFAVLPFTVNILNIFIGWCFGIFIILLEAFFVNHASFFPFFFVVHSFIIISLSAILIYASASKK